MSFTARMGLCSVYFSELMYGCNNNLNLIHISEQIKRSIPLYLGHFNLFLVNLKLLCVAENDWITDINKMLNAENRVILTSVPHCLLPLPLYRYFKN